MSEDDYNELRWEFFKASIDGMKKTSDPIIYEFFYGIGLFKINEKLNKIYRKLHHISEPDAKIPLHLQEELEQAKISREEALKMEKKCYPEGRQIRGFIL